MKISRRGIVPDALPRLQDVVARTPRQGNAISGNFRRKPVVVGSDGFDPGLLEHDLDTQMRYGSPVSRPPIDATPSEPAQVAAENHAAVRGLPSFYGRMGHWLYRRGGESRLFPLRDAPESTDTFLNPRFAQH